MKRTFLLVIATALAFSCTTERKLASLREARPTAGVSPVVENTIPEFSVGKIHRDTLQVKGEDGQEVLIMKAVKDENGEMVATDVIQAAKVTARFRNVAERHGKVDLAFDVTVPGNMQDQRWRIWLWPDLFVMGDSTRLEPVVITGSDYRQEQLRGYEQYERFLSRIITDSTLFLHAYQLDCFIRRNIPELWKFRADTGYVTDSEFYSHYGVSEQEAVDHYRKRLLMKKNSRRIGRKGLMFRRFVPEPIVSEGLRLDTVIQADGGDLVYRYTQTIATRPGLRKADVVLSGKIEQMGRLLYSIPPSAPLTFYISSLGFLADNTERYKTMVVGRRVEANTACYIDFEKGKWDVDPSLDRNGSEIERIKGNISSLLRNEKYDMDSILVTASCSPEGGQALNRRLSARRAEAVNGFFRNYVRTVRDSLRSESGIVLDYAGVGEALLPQEIEMRSRSDGENWQMLDMLVSQDTVLTDNEKKDYEMIGRAKDPDERERLLSEKPYYPRLRQVLYPRLRTVRFDFHMHRKGMVKDTIHTTVLDTLYMSGVQALKDHDYRKAVTILRPYNDFNSAVACCAMDYDASAMAILERLPSDGKTNYLKAILYSRSGDDQNAVQCYLDACSEDRAYVSRGNLDPEISELIRRYGLNKDDDEIIQ